MFSAPCCTSTYICWSHRHYCLNSIVALDKLNPPPIVLCTYIVASPLLPAVALNGEQYGGSLMCGACLEGTANGNGSGGDPISSTFKGFITDR